MMLFCRNFFVSIFDKIICFFVFTPSKKLKLSDHNVYVHTLHSDEVVSLLISGCEKSCTL